MKKKSVLLRAPVLTQSGYGTHARQIYRWLSSVDSVDLAVEALNWGQTPWLLDESAHDGLVKDIIDRCIETKSKKFDVSFQLQLPNEWDNSLATFNVGMTAAVETDVCNPEWARHINKMDIVVVPSLHSKKCLESCVSLTTKIIVIPECFPECFNDPVEPLSVDFAAKFNFLIVGQLTSGDPQSDRKRVLDTVAWLCEAFDGDEDVGVVVKTNMGKMTKIDRQISETLLTRALASRKTQYPRVHLLHGAMTDKEMSALYSHERIKAFVTCTRGEGFGLPMLEAAAKGLPVVATNWSAHAEFLSKGKFIKLDSVLAEIPPARIDRQSAPDARIFVEGARWANVSEADFKRKVTKLKENYVMPREWARELQEQIKRSYSQESINALYSEAFMGVLT